MKFKWMFVGLLLTATAFAQTEGATTFMEAMNVVMKKMDDGMMNAFMNGNPDHDFATMMIPHHQGAIDMAKVELRFGKDPAMRQLAEKIIADQQTEIGTMTGWLKKN